MAGASTKSRKFSNFREVPCCYLSALSPPGSKTAEISGNASALGMREERSDPRALEQEAPRRIFQAAWDPQRIAKGDDFGGNLGSKISLVNFIFINLAKVRQAKEMGFGADAAPTGVWRTAPSGGPRGSRGTEPYKGNTTAPNPSLEPV